MPLFACFDAPHVIAQPKVQRRLSTAWTSANDVPQGAAQRLAKVVDAASQGTATYLYQDGPRYWYSTQPTVTKLAEDRAEQLKRDPDKVAREADKRLRGDLRKAGDFNRVHPLPASSADVPDDLDARLVVLGVDHAYSRDPGNAAETAAKAILETRGGTPRLYRNTLVFLAADKTRLQDLDEAVRHYLAWESILADQQKLDLSPHQVRQAEEQKGTADGVVTARLPETYQWLLVPVQSSPQAVMAWEAFRLTGQDALTIRASSKLRRDELLLTAFSGTRLRMELDRVPLWRGDHVAVKQLAEDFARYLYLPRLKEPSVLAQAVRDGVGLLTWQQDSFAYAEFWDEAGGRYRGLQAGRQVSVATDGQGLLVRPDVAARQLAAEAQTAPEGGGEGGRPREQERPYGERGVRLEPPSQARLRRFHGSVSLDPIRLTKDAGQIAQEVVQHLTGLVGAKVEIVLEIHAEVPDGVPDNVVRAVTENCRTLKFKSQGFEEA